MVFAPSPRQLCPPSRRFPPRAAASPGSTRQASRPQKYLPETSGAGCAFLDYDNDGWMDIYLVNSGKCDFYTPPRPLRNALYRNNRDGTFTDVTEKAGVAGGGYGMGVAVGDYDGDGFPDLYRHAVRPQHPLPQQRRRNLHRCHGESGRRRSRLELERRLVRLRQRRPARPVRLPVRGVRAKQLVLRGSTATGEHHYCIPRIFKPAPSWLFHNNGDGTFTDVSKESGIADHLGQGVGGGGDGS